MVNVAYDTHEDDQPSGDAPAVALTPLAYEDLPERHPVRLFADVYFSLVEGQLLPHADALMRRPELSEVFGWAKLIEPIEMNGAVDFKVIRQGNKLQLSEGHSHRDRWMSDTVDPEFVRATYTEIIAASVLRKPLFSRGAVPHRARSFLFLLRGTFPVFADNRARLRLFKIEAQPYVQS